MSDLDAAAHPGLWWYPVPAADFGCAMRIPGCTSTACRPNPRPCDEFAGRWSDVWCPCCGWAAWAHIAVAVSTS